MTDDGGPAQSGRVALTSRVEQMCRQSLEPVGVDGGSVALVTARGHRATVCATDAVASAIEDHQFLLGEGPCVDASTMRSPVLVADLRNRSEGVYARWPGFLEAAAQSGVRAIFAFPLRIGAIAFGAMDLYRTRPGGLEAGQLRAGLLTADAVALVLLDLATDDDPAGSPAPSAFHLIVHGAAGMVMGQLGVTIEQALAQLRAVAFAQARSVDDVASDVVAGRLRFPQEDSHDPPRR